MLALVLGVCYTMYVNEREDLKMFNDYYFAQLHKIEEICNTLGIPCVMEDFELEEGYILRFLPWSDGDIACHDGTYGSNDGMVESYRFSWDGDGVSMLTVEEAVVYIILEYNNYKKMENNPLLFYSSSSIL